MKIDKVKIVIVSVFIFFTLWGIYDIIIWNKDYIADRFLFSAIAIAAFFLRKKINLTLPLTLVGLVPIVIHSIKLYGNIYFGIPYDHYMHFFAGFALAMILFNYMYHLDGKKSIHIFVFAILLSAGLGSFMEIMEFLGYAVGGEGGGLIFYGAGDFGEWNNAVRDMICNTLGATVGSAISTKSL